MSTSLPAGRTSLDHGIGVARTDSSVVLARLALAALGLTLGLATEVQAAPAPQLGPNVLVFTPDMPVIQI